MKYGCHNGERPVAGDITHLAQDGYSPPYELGNKRFGRDAVWKPVHYVFAPDCQYDQAATDQRCTGCKHIKHGE